MHTEGSTTTVETPTATLNVANATKWIEALESGEYPQGTQMLKTLDGAYCCLGVACALMGLEEEKTNEGFSFIDPDFIPEPLDEGETEAFQFHGRYDTFPPAEAFSKWLGLPKEKTAYGFHWPDNINVGLDNDWGDDILVSALNDKGEPFAMIADRLRLHFGIPKAD